MVATAIVLLVAIIGGNIALIEAHESAHKKIFAYYGVESEIEYRWDVNAIAVTVPTTRVPAENWQFIYGLQALNEVVGYQMIALFNIFAIFISFVVFLFIYLIPDYEEEEEEVEEDVGKV